MADNSSRAAIRRRSRKPKHTRSKTPMTIAVVIIVAVFGFGIWAAIQQRAANAKAAPKPPVGSTPGDHWHAFIGVDVCGTWLDNAPEFEQISSTRNAGIHSHGDGLMHIHPFQVDESGKNATVGKFMTYGGWKLSSDSMTLWDGKTHRNGQECPAGSNYEAAAAATSTTAAGADASTSTTMATTAQKAFIVWTVNGKVQSGDPAKYRPKNGDIIAIGFLPKGVQLTEPPGAKAAIDQSTAGRLPDQIGGATGTPVQVPAAPSSAP